MEKREEIIRRLTEFKQDPELRAFGPLFDEMLSTIDIPEFALRNLTESLLNVYTITPLICWLKEHISIPLCILVTKSGTNMKINSLLKAVRFASYSL